uniref:Uncharacterized protein n=1 Tax=Arundo donax TaxID=35708 RepID=A0A0A8ZES8_ARUDO
MCRPPLSTLISSPRGYLLLSSLSSDPV